MVFYAGGGQAPCYEKFAPPHIPLYLRDMIARRLSLRRPQLMEIRWAEIFLRVVRGYLG